MSDSMRPSRRDRDEFNAAAFGLFHSVLIAESCSASREVHRESVARISEAWFDLLEAIHADVPGLEPLIRANRE